MANKILFLISIMIMSSAKAYASSFNDFVDNYIAKFTDAIANFIFTPINIFGAEVPIIILWILMAGIIFTIYFKFIPIWGFKHSISLIVDSNKKNSGEGEVSAFQALATALSGTIGMGSIAGVAIAISIGGPGAAFWILIGAIFGMSLKFAEASAALIYRTFNSDGSVSGGPMHYIAHGLTKKKLRWLGQPLSVLFAIVFIGGAFTGGNLIQINQTTQMFISITGGSDSFLGQHAWFFGLIIALIVGMITIGGIKSIAKVTEKIVPFMCLLYVIGGLAVVAINIQHIPHALAIIIKQAFFPESVVGGIFGTIIIGLRRSVQTNEAGTGSAPIVYAAAKTNEPIAPGFVSLMEPLICGMMCLLTAFIVTVTGTYVCEPGKITGIEMVADAFALVMPFFPKILTVVVMLFALSTLISWAYYGQKCWNFLFGEGKKRSIFFHLIYCIIVVIGSELNVKSVINIVDAMMISTSVPNIIALYILAPEIKKHLKRYCNKLNISSPYNTLQTKAINNIELENVKNNKVNSK
ncbi:alanine:cation symporter family protein [bacterium]|nr:alanine:cation symporter family protein [bacterium]